MITRIMNERYIKWYTPWLDREFEMLAFGNGGGLPLIIFQRHSAVTIKTKILVWSVQLPDMWIAVA